MKLRPLPLIEELNALPPEQSTARREAVCRDFFNSPAAQIVADMFRQYEHQALSALRTEPASPDRVQRLLGRIQLIEDLRTALTAMVPQSESAVFAEADEESEIFLQR